MKKTTLAIAAALAAAMAFAEEQRLADSIAAAAEAKAVVQKGSFADKRDGKKYKTAKIGEQTWMAENLNYNASGSKCYENKPANCAKYGRLYDWDAAMKACPSGWHLPTKEEWEAMTNYVGGKETEGKYLKAKSGCNKNGNGTDKFGFAALPGGIGLPDDSFHSAGGDGYWWSASEDGANYAYYRLMYCYFEYANGYYGVKNWLQSVRCLQD